VFIKENAVEVLERQLRRLEPGVVSMGGVCDSYQPIEKERGVTRGVVEVLCQHQFPVEVLTKSDLVLRDLELYQEAGRRAWSCVFFTITTFDEQIAGRFEPGASSPQRRLEAMRAVSRAGLATGVSMMPLLPGICDDDEHIEEVVRRVKDAGGQFVLGAGLTLKEGVQRDRYMGFLEQHYPQTLPLYQQLYGSGYEGSGYETRGEYAPVLLRRVREICSRHGIADRMSRPVLHGDPLAANKRIAERLFLKAYDLFLDQAASYRQWAYRKAAWAVDEMEEDVAELYRRDGRKGLQSIKGIGKKLAGEIEGWLRSAAADSGEEAPS
jgi:DNA repair photolyase